MVKKHLLRYRFIAFGFSLLISFSIFSIYCNPTTVKATPVAGNSTVIIAVDVTNTFKNEPCYQIFTYSIGAAKEKIIRTGCPIGAIIVTQFVPQAQAISLHERYTNNIPENASLSEKIRLKQDIRKLMDLKKKSLQSSKSNYTLNPDTIFPCGQTSSAQQSWSPNGSSSYASTISFYKSLDCSTLGFQTSRLYVNSAGATTYIWDHDEYGSLPWMGAGCQTLTNGNHWHGVSNMASGTGSTWENLVEWNDPVCYPQSRDMYAHNDIGPLR